MPTKALGSPSDWRKWIALAIALVGVGILPRTWMKFLALAALPFAVFD